MANELVSEMWLQKTTSLDEKKLAAWESRLGDPTVSGLPGAGSSITTTTGEDGVPVVEVKITWKSPARKDGEQSTYVTWVSMP